MQGSSTLKRKRQDGVPLESLTPQERIVYDIIKRKEGMGIWTRDMKRETNLADHMVNKALKSLQVKNLIKEVVNIQNKGRKHYMASEFEPSKEITGGDWYENGNLDVDFIKFLKDFCLKHISRKKVATVDNILEFSKKSGAFNVEFTKQQIGEIVQALVLDNEIVEVRSTGIGEFASIPKGTVCYKCTSKSGPKGTGAMASIPCGVCPRISSCTPDGIISPITCVYYQKWLDF